MNYKEHTNRNGDTQLFVHASENKVLWFADFKFCRIIRQGFDKITMIDPSGGPYFSLETPSKFIPGLENTDKEIKSLKLSKDFTYLIIKLKNKDGK